MPLIKIVIFAYLIFPTYSVASQLETLIPGTGDLESLAKSHSRQKVVIQNFYYPKIGSEEKVLALRIRASDILQEFGLKQGKVLSRKSSNISQDKETGTVLILWQAEYESLDALEAEMDNLSGKKLERFEKEISSKMRPLLMNFDRAIYSVEY